MIINDKLYGTFNINEPILIDLLNSKAISRLKGISMGGYYPAYPIIQSEDLNRYHHSIGVFLLLRKFNASIEEQIAGLIHDTSHSAFSHTIDYIKECQNDEEQKTQSGQDDIHENFIKHSDIYEILEKHSFDISYILDDKNFPLKENNTPDICADRIDYSIRTAYAYKAINDEQKDYLINSLRIYNGSFVFKDFNSSQFFAKMFWNMDQEHWSGIKSAVMFTLSGNLFKIAIKNKYLKFADFYELSDFEIIEKIKPHINKDLELKKYYEDLHLTKENFTNNPNDYIRKIFCKLRVVDPYFITPSYELKRVSELDKDFAKQLKSINKFKEYFVSKIEK